MTQTVIPKDTLIKVGGKRYRCPTCGSNVFRPVQDTERPSVLIYRCNGCGDQFVGEKVEAQP